MTTIEIAKVGKEFYNNYYKKYHHYVTINYKFGEQIKTCTMLQLTEEGKSIMMSETLNAKVFTCPWCGKKVSYNELEIWSEDDIDEIVNNEVPCSYCYEDLMGEDL